MPDTSSDISQAGPPLWQHRLYALKDGDAFVVSDASGDIYGAADGLFRNDTRHLSLLRLTIGEVPLSLLSAAVSEDNVFFTSHGANRPLAPIGGIGMPEGVVHVERRRFLTHERMYERIRCTSYNDARGTLALTLHFDADFRDIFEIRGHERAHRGEICPPSMSETQVEFLYHGLDGVERRTLVEFSLTPTSLGPHAALFELAIEPAVRTELFFEIGFEAAPRPSQQRFEDAAHSARTPMRDKLRRGAKVGSSSVLFNSWLAKSRADLALLVSDLPTGPYPYAGIPWFSTTFGRDAVIAAWHTLWLDPGLARGVLAFLARTQATEHSAFRDAAPGKVLHEMRRGEMANCGEVAFARYYGGVDTTCLFVALAAAYADRTGDLAFVEALWPALSAAVDWMESFALTHGGLVTYQRGAQTGLANQGWKDSQDSVFHADGRLAEGPIALVEVQGYAFAAYRGMGRLAHRRGDEDAAHFWSARAEHFRNAVEQRFWMEEEGFYGIAIDGDGELCRVRGSNAGHLLFVGLPTMERGRMVAHHLVDSAFATGWGLRTLASGQARYNPMSYHNGSVWPHDTAICVAGLARYGAVGAGSKILANLFEAASRFDMRLPELFCGFARAGSSSPVGYPVACVPQAWAASSVFGMLQACLGVVVDGWNGAVRITDPHLPHGVDNVDVHELDVCGREIGLSFRHIDHNVTVLRTPKHAGGPPIFVET